MSGPGARRPGTVGEAVRAAAHALGAGAAGRLEAEILVARAARLARVRVLAFPETPLAPAAADALARLVERRVRGEPLAYLTGEREFWSLRLRVSPATLVPRPETELLVEVCLAALPAHAPAAVADLGTGAGPVALALARERPRWRVVATDVDPRALAVAEANARHLGIAGVEFRAGDWCAALPPDRAFDLLAANPPYVRAGDPALLGDGVRHEPRLALAAGADGLDAIRVIVREAPAHLRPGGHLVLEHGFDQRRSVAGLLEAAGLGVAAVHDDLAGRARVIHARRPG